MALRKNTEVHFSIFEQTHGKRSAKAFACLLAMGFLITVFLLPTVASSQVRGSSSSAQRIKFAIGAVSAQTSGQFTPANERPRFVIKAKAGDHMIVNVIPVTRTLTMAGTIKSPSGEGDGGPGGIIMNANLTESGDYTIEVFQHTMGSNLASGKFILEVVITPAWLKN